MHTLDNDSADDNDSAEVSKPLVLDHGEYHQLQRIALGHSWIKQEEMKKYEEKYTPEIVRKIGDLAKQVGGHGGMDFMMDWRLIDCLRNGLPLDQDVYDAALWSVVVPLSEKSIRKRSDRLTSLTLT